MTQNKDPLGDVASFSYDGNETLSGVTDPLGRTDAMTNDALSQLTKNIDPAGNQTTLAYNNSGGVVQLKDALNGVTAIVYQPGRHGRLPISVIDANNHATSLNYDVLGREINVKNALGQTASINYNANSLPTSVTTRNGQTISLSYDNLNRPTQITAPEGNYAITYDAVGNMTSVNDPNSSALAASFDSLNRPTQLTQTLPNGYNAALRQTFDANGNRTSLATPFGSFSYTYDSLNRMTSETNPFGQTVSFTYDSLGRPVRTALPNGTQTSYAFDTAGQVLQVMHQKTSNQSPVAFANYTYDIDGNRTSITDMSGSHTFSYDKLNRLVTANHPSAANLPILSETFTYDTIGNRTSDVLRTNYVYDAANRLQSDSSFTYTTDANGNTTSRTSRSSGNETTFVYDSRNSLISANGPSGVSGAYKYDPAGRRVERTVNGTTYRYIYDGLRLIATLDANNNLLTFFTYGPVGVAPVSMRSSGQDFFFHTDALGSVVALTDINGNIVETYEYEAFGKAVVTDAQGNTHNQSTVGNPFMFAGIEFDSETGLYHMGFRYEGPETGRFLQEDPVASINQFAYAGNNPTLLIDPLGLEWQISGGGSGSFGGFFLLGLFLGGGVNVGVTSGGRAFIQLQGSLEYGSFFFIGAGAQGGISHSNDPIPDGLSEQTYGQGDVNLGWGDAVGGSVQYAPSTGDVGVGFPLPTIKAGAGFGLQGSAGVGGSLTLATPSIFNIWNRVKACFGF